MGSVFCVPTDEEICDVYDSYTSPHILERKKYDDCSDEERRSKELILKYQIGIIIKDIETENKEEQYFSEDLLAPLLQEQVLKIATEAQAEAQAEAQELEQRLLRQADRENSWHEDDWDGFFDGFGHERPEPGEDDFGYYSDEESVDISF